MFRLELDLYTFADLRRPGRLASVGRAFDADPRLAVDRIDTREPVRNIVASAEGYLSDASYHLANGDILFERRREPHLSGELAAPAYHPDESPDQAHRLHADTADSDELWFVETENQEAYAQLFVRLAGGFDAYYGFATDHQMPRQQAGEFARTRRAGRFAPQTPGPESDLHSVRDIYWLNYFGPAYVEMWGERLKGLGVRQLSTTNGGVVVWATESPFVHDETVASFVDYPWKKPFYKALGLETFVNALTTSWDRRVPSRADHLRCLAPKG